MLPFQREETLGFSKCTRLLVALNFFFVVTRDRKIGSCNLFLTVFQLGSITEQTPALVLFSPDAKLE
jgi:hypothetical protein